MAHKGYEIGARFERRVKKYYEDLGYFVVKSAGSKSPVDLICTNTKETICIQCRIRGNLSEDEMGVLISLRENYLPSNGRVLLVYKHNKGLRFRNI